MQPLVWFRMLHDGECLAPDAPLQGKVGRVRALLGEKEREPFVEEGNRTLVEGQPRREGRRPLLRGGLIVMPCDIG